MADVIKRHQFADYLDCGDGTSASFKLCGAGFTALNESPGAQTESVMYVNDKSASSSVVSYETQFPFDAEFINSEDAIAKIYEIARNHAVGAEAEADFVRVELWDQAEEGGTPVANTYKARKFRISIEVSDITGENKMTMSGNFNAIGDPIDGTFNTSTKTFTPAGGSTPAVNP